MNWLVPASNTPLNLARATKIRYNLTEKHTKHIFKQLKSHSVGRVVTALTSVCNFLLLLNNLLALESRLCRPKTHLIVHTTKWFLFRLDFFTRELWSVLYMASWFRASIVWQVGTICWFLFHYLPFFNCFGRMQKFCHNSNARVPSWS